VRRPARVRNSPDVHGYVAAPALAWSGWRLQIPGGPEGGQYHGYTGDDSDQVETASTLCGVGDDPVWGGTALHEGQTLSDHVYRSPGEVRPRANASGNANAMWEYQTKRSPGYAESPGNYHALGMQIPFSDAVSRGLVNDPCVNAGSGESYCRQSIASQTYYVPDPAPVPVPAPVLSQSPQMGWPAGATEPTLPVMKPPTQICPDFMIACPSGSTVKYATDACRTPSCVPNLNTVAQPSPDTQVNPNTVSVYTVPPISPSPAPTVAASAADYLPATGQPLPGAAALPTTDVGSWLTQSSIWSAVPNWVLVAGGALLLFRRGKK
jgi:hypothetical protein